MSKPSKRTPERKLQVVLSVLRGEVSVAEAARIVDAEDDREHEQLASLSSSENWSVRGPRGQLNL